MSILYIIHNFKVSLVLNKYRSNEGPRKIAQPAIFQAVWRGIGISFQSAIIAPRMNLIGYDNATAQSYRPTSQTTSYAWNIRKRHVGGLIPHLHICARSKMN